MKKNTFFAVIATLLLCACGQSGVKESVEHFWDDYDFTSDKGLSPIEKAEERFGNYMTLLGKVDTATAAQSIRDFMTKAAADTVSYFVYSDFFAAALYPIDSPFRNASLLRVYLKKAIEDGIALDYLRFDEEEMLRKSYLNQPGSIACDSEVLLSDGSQTTVLSLAAESPQTLLLLVGQAGCRSCIDMMEELAEKMPKRTALVAVVNSNYYGEADWLREQLPSRWTVAVASESFLEDYDFGLAPARYMLNRHGKIKSLK